MTCPASWETYFPEFLWSCYIIRTTSMSGPLMISVGLSHLISAHRKNTEAAHQKNAEPAHRKNTEAVLRISVSGSRQLEQLSVRLPSYQRDRFSVYRGGSVRPTEAHTNATRFPREEQQRLPYRFKRRCLSRKR
jgi:hypothetical protein